jgi:SseB protein C-terminal domain/SseB protein N-terminal domain
MNEDSENALELALMKAATEPEHRPEFYRLLVESEVFVLGHSESRSDGRWIAAAGENLSIVNWQKNDGAPIIPFFTSLNALRRAIKEEQSFLALPARSLFEITKGATLILNPASPYGKEFFPNEIEALLATGMNQMPQTRVVQQATEVLLGEPANYPAEMVSALTNLLAKHPSVKAAYLCLMHDPSVHEQPSLVVGFEGEPGIERAMQEAGSVAVDTAPKGQPVDFIKITRGNQGIDAYLFDSVKPFYERTWGSKLKSLFRPGRA